jgi:hypothetical protein
MPIGAGFLVAWLQAQGFSPGLKFLTRAIEGVVDDDRNASMPKSYGQVEAGGRVEGNRSRRAAAGVTAAVGAVAAVLAAGMRFMSHRCCGSEG